MEEEQRQIMMDRVEAAALSDADVAEVVEPGEFGGPDEPHHCRHPHVGILPHVSSSFNTNVAILYGLQSGHADGVICREWMAS
ncbi:hypothetical protein Scep_024256 [Stephania cephalantha]|uniref:Uncharacterized protein n=1 Tax=Stephania cephalantha TaxID=152367 RepID=A0AAP0EXD4_9MAGN